MNVYDYINAFSVAVRDNTPVKDYCVTNFKKGLLVKVDDDNEDPTGSKDSPYCLLMSTIGSDDSPVAEGTLANIRLEVGTIPATEPPYFTDTTERTNAANGLRKYGQGEKAVDLLELILTAIKGKALDADTILESSSIEANGSLFFPLALAVSILTVSKKKTMDTFE